MKLVGMKSILAAGLLASVAMATGPALAELSVDQDANVRSVIANAADDQAVINGLEALLGLDGYKDHVEDVAALAAIVRPDLAVAIGTLIFRMYPDRAEAVFKIIAEVAKDPNALAAAMAQPLTNSLDGSPQSGAGSYKAPDLPAEDPLTPVQNTQS